MPVHPTFEKYKGHILLIHCESDEVNKMYDTMQMVRKQLKEHPECRYIFIDDRSIKGQSKKNPQTLENKGFEECG